jgi:hypothetical protein
MMVETEGARTVLENAQYYLSEDTYTSVMPN